jgi:AAA family ATP:ADP antiporter
VVEQESRYKAKNIIDVVVYRAGDFSAIWVQTGLRMLGFGMGGVLGLGLISAGAWAASAWSLGRQYERRRSEMDQARAAAALRAE